MKNFRFDKRIMAAILIAVSILSLAYYGVCIAFAYIGVSWLWIWPSLSVFCLVRAGMLIYEVKKQRNIFPKPVRIAWRAMVCVGLSCFIFVEAQIISQMRQESPQGLDYIIILGAAVRGDKPTSPLVLRMEKALEYMNSNPDTIAIATGGTGRNADISEAECIRRYLTENGISPERILMEEKASDTQENIRNSFAMIQNENASVGVVTSNFHVFRALLICRLEGHEGVYGVPARAYLALGIHYTVREFFGVMELLIK